MTFSDYFINLVLSAILIIGAYQFYFFTQRHPLRKPIVWDSVVDEEIPFRPRWSWVYSFLYYPAILYLNLIATDHRHFIMMAFSFLVLLFMQMVFTVCAEIRPIQQLLPQHARFRRHADCAARHAGHGRMGIPFPRLNRDFLHIYQAALSHRPAGRCRTGRVCLLAVPPGSLTGRHARQISVILLMEIIGYCKQFIKNTEITASRNSLTRKRPLRFVRI